ncbi:MAG: hypothetical protein ACE5FW_00135 [Candidatus Aenigmatarchaeota archaeon]
MSRKLKGLAGEELPATLFAIILLFVFLGATLVSYSNFYSRAAFIEQERTASSLAQKILAETGGIVTSPQAFLDQYKLQNTRINITDLDTGFVWSSPGSTEGLESVAASSLALLIGSGSAYHPGRVDVYVGK